MIRVVESESILSPRRTRSLSRTPPPRRSLNPWNLRARLAVRAPPLISSNANDKPVRRGRMDIDGRRNAMSHGQSRTRNIFLERRKLTAARHSADAQRYIPCPVAGAYLLLEGKYTFSRSSSPFLSLATLIFSSIYCKSIGRDILGATVACSMLVNAAERVKTRDSPLPAWPTQKNRSFGDLMSRGERKRERFAIAP